MPSIAANAPAALRPPRARRRLVLAAGVALAALLAPAIASAGTIQLVGQYPQRKHGDTQSSRLARADDDYAGNAGINRTDCDSDETWSFSFVLPAAGFNFLQVWAKSDDTGCSDPQYRPGGANPQCWKVASFDYAKVANGGIVAVKSSDIVKAIYRKVNVDDATYPTAKDICYPTESTQPAKVYLHFLLFDSAGNVVGATSSNEYESVYQTTYDLVGPAPPSDVSLGVGETILVAKWTASTSAEKDFVSYRAYCFKKRGSESDPFGGLDGGLFGDATTKTDSGADSASGADAGTDAADASDAAETSTTDSASDGADADGSSTTIPTNCPSLPSGFQAGVLPSAELEVLNCGSAGTTSGRLQIDGLKNDNIYAVAIAAVDKYGNSGLLSNVACNAPVQTTDFFDAYRADGGKGGGGFFCGFGGGGASSALAFGGALATFALIARRARRNGRAGGGR